MFPEPGRRFGPYEILGRLGGGGMGSVFRAWDGRLHREVAIKLLHDEYAMAGMRERFLREARAASALNHPNICTVFDIGEQDGDPYLVMELLEGATLKERIESTSMPLDEVLCVATEVAEALGAAHAKGIIHRDIKPANIFLLQKPNGGVQAKILDFGLAKIEAGVLGARGGRAADITTAGATVGTLSYMSPEQARGEQLDSRSDLFSLGVVMYEMTTRRIPFPGATSALVFVKLLNEQPELVRDWNEAVPRELEKIIFKLIAKERTARFQTTQELAQALKQFEERNGSGGWLRKAVSTVPLVRAPEPVARDRRSTRRLAEPEPKTLELETQAAAAGQATSDTHFLRPVVRIPRGETPRASGQESGNGAAAVAMTALNAEAAEGRSTSGVAESTPGGANSAVRFESGTAAEADPGTPGLATAVSSAVPMEATEIERSEDAVASEFRAAEVSGQPRRLLRKISPRSIAYSIVLLLVLSIAVTFVAQRGRFGEALLTRDDLVVVTTVRNQSGVKEFDGAAGLALELALRQSPYLRLSRSDAFEQGRQQVVAATSAQRVPEENGQVMARNVANRMHSKAYLYGSIQETRAPYLLKVELIDTDSDEVRTTIEERFNSGADLLGAVDRVATELRLSVGESRESVKQTAMPVEQDATASLPLLRKLEEARALRVSGKTLESLHGLQETVGMDAHFAEAQMELATAYRRLRAETAAADASRVALADAKQSSPRTRLMAECEYQMNAEGDYPRAVTTVRELLTTYPHDLEAENLLARALRLEGHLSEALQVAQQAFTEDPFDADAYTQAEFALNGLDRFDAAYQLDMQAQRLGVSKPGSSLASAYLEGRQSGVEEALANFTHAGPAFGQQWNYGIYLDNIGRLTSGAAAWRSYAAEARQTPGLASSAGFLLAQGAYDRALIADCNAALPMIAETAALPLGLIATFHKGMVAALCGDPTTANAVVAALEQQYPSSFDVRGFYVADIRAALALGAGDAQTAVEVLQPARQYDLISLTPYLRGQAHVKLHQEQIGIVDFQTVLAHRGIPFVVGNEAYPAAQIGVARAFSATGDSRNSAEAYRNFLELWKDADARQPLLLEARTHSGQPAGAR